MFSWFKSKAKPANAAAPVITPSMPVLVTVPVPVPAAVANTPSAPQPAAPASSAAVAPLLRFKSTSVRAKPQLMVLNRVASAPIYGARKPAVQKVPSKFRGREREGSHRLAAAQTSA